MCLDWRRNIKFRYYNVLILISIFMYNFTRVHAFTDVYIVVLQSGCGNLSQGDLKDLFLIFISQKAHF